MPQFPKPWPRLAQNRTAHILLEPVLLDREHIETMLGHMRTQYDTTSTALLHHLERLASCGDLAAHILTLYVMSLRSMHAQHLQTIRHDLLKGTPWVAGQENGIVAAAGAKKRATAARVRQWRHDAEMIMDEHPDWTPWRVAGAIAEKYPGEEEDTPAHPNHASVQTIYRHVFAQNRASDAF